MFGCKGNLFQYPIGIDGYTYGFCIASQPYYTSTDRQRRGRGATPRNQQHENFVINYPFSLSGLGLRRMVGITKIHLYQHARC
ncbi:hypothetical protein Pint_33064 [Pistacia integerrima]|uniref:Uncharacterized protein n=1 Tax=Pistacia integerrima TaxID=434235 RepID=A0ACC0X7D4_9ROSI|nr:hypothetical protein Pint_33064 [Pistacia integerrima]